MFLKSLFKFRLINGNINGNILVDLLGFKLM